MGIFYLKTGWLKSKTVGCYCACHQHVNIAKHARRRIRLLMRQRSVVHQARHHQALELSAVDYLHSLLAPIHTGAQNRIANN